ncbi:MAG: hypothetical protein AAGI68_16220 [Planctomycetota bacterium]
MSVATDMVSQIQTALASSPAGVVEVSVDGEVVKWNRSQAISELRFWEAKVARETSKRRIVRPVNLSGGRL